MNIEVEVKIQWDNLGEIRAKLPEFGKLQKSILQVDEYYVPVHRDFFAQKPQPVEWVRVRTNPDKVFLEYHRSVDDKQDDSLEYTEEYETEVGNPENLHKILAFLDFRNVVTVEKQREYWDCGKFEVVLDDVKNLGTFIEVEAKGEFTSHKEAKQACKDFLVRLGIPYSPDFDIRKGYPAMLLEKDPR